MSSRFNKILTTFKSDVKELAPSYVSFGMILLYLSLINFFVLKATPEVIFIQFAIVILIFKKLRFLDFTKSWLPFIAFFVLYEYIRGFLDNISPFYQHTLLWIYDLELLVFNGLPTIYLQQIIPNSQIITSISVFFYSIFFYYSFLVALLIWLKKPHLFKSYSKKFIVFTYVCLSFYFFIPTAPPWMVAKSEPLPLTRYLYSDTVLANFAYPTIYRYFVQGNEVAAFPSLHVGWPLFTAIFLIRHIKSKLMYLNLIVPLMICFSVVLTGEHYIFDGLGSLLIAIIILKSDSNYSQKHVLSQLN